VTPSPERSARARDQYRRADYWGKLRAPIITTLLAAAVAVTATAHAFAVDIKTVDDSDGKTITILLTGQIVAGDGLKVRSFIGSVAGSKSMTVQLGFAGGIRADAMSIGRFFHQAGIHTAVPGKVRCVSPCPLVLVGGRDRIAGKPAYVKYSSASLGFSSVTSNYQEKDYTLADLDGAVASAQRDILQIADYLRDVGADINMLRYYQSVLKQNEIQFITNEQALDLGIPVMFEETGQVIEPLKLRP
jgi:hypothetical protein